MATQTDISSTASHPSLYVDVSINPRAPNPAYLSPWSEARLWLWRFHKHDSSLLEPFGGDGFRNAVGFDRQSQRHLCLRGFMQPDHGRLLLWHLTGSGHGAQTERIILLYNAVPP
jgi:hypothetical protein